MLIFYIVAMMIMYSVINGSYRMKTTHTSGLK
jgi:hypothetical protein